ncbi:MAG: FtsX-like permease family protein [Ekhidna sp.]|uniref:ABC transporter permease n=1 Tax=Ekhidna sp. TaxID=2608089 RepID=UPI0032EE187F
MLKNLFVSALRSLKKKPGFTTINVLGLAIGMATCLSILLYVNHELSYDSFQDDNVYRLALNRVYPEREVDFVIIPHSISPQMVNDFPEVVNQTRLFRIPNVATFQYEGETITEDKLVFADSTIFSLLSIKLIEGDVKTALKEPNSIVITESAAKKYFGDEKPLGKILQGPQGNTLEVTAIAEDYPEKSHFEFGAIVALHSIPFLSSPNWASFSVMSYIELAPGASYEELEEKMPAFIKQYAEGEIQQRNGISYDEYIAAGNGYNYSFQPIRDIYLTSHLSGEMKPNGNITYVYIFSIAAAFILIIACINFMNLSTARSVERAKEVGIRKVMGSHRKQLVAQFLSESTLVAMLSAMLAIVIAWLFQPVFAQLSGRDLSVLGFFTPVNILILIGVVIAIGVLAGLYPAFFISSYSPIGILRGSMKTSGKGVMLRNVLVVLQFSISIALISATLLIYNQMDFMLNKPLGFDKEQVVVIENGFAVNNNPQQPNWDRFKTFRNELVSTQEVSSAGYSSSLPGDVLQGFIVRVPGDGQKESLVTRMLSMDDQFMETMGMEILEGRGFSPEFNDSLSIILNEATVEKLALSDPIGKRIIHVDDSSQVSYTVIGVVKDFHFESLHSAMEPIAITSMGSPQSFVNKYAVKISLEDMQRGLASIEEKWNEFAPQTPFRYYFLDNSLESFYESEKASGRLFTVFTVLAVIVACIGLLGLSAFIITQKTKEIGVRKVLGSSVSGIVFLLSKDIIKLIVISTVIAIPAAYFWVSGWLENFAYADRINWLIFIVAGLGALLIAFLTTSIQSTKAARANPVESLRDE